MPIAFVALPHGLAADACDLGRPMPLDSTLVDRRSPCNDGRGRIAEGGRFDADNRRSGRAFGAEYAEGSYRRHCRRDQRVWPARENLQPSLSRSRAATSRSPPCMSTTAVLVEHADPDAPPKVSVSVMAPRSCEWGKGRWRDATSARRSERPRNNRFDVDISLVAQSNGDGHRLRRAPRRAYGEGPYFERSLVDPLLDRSGGRQ